MKLRPLLLIFVSAASGVYWGVEVHATTLLQARLSATRDRQNEIARLRQEHERLIRLQPSIDELERLREKVSRARQGVHPIDDQASPGIAALRRGTWAPAASWRNQGRATPEAALETVLWAASGGNVEALKETLALAPETRMRAEELITSLQATDRHQLTSTEDFVALLVAGNVPLESAQWVARQQNQDDQAIEYLRLKDSHGNTRQVFLSLQKSSGGWQLTVPPSVINPIALAEGSLAASNPEAVSK